MKNLTIDTIERAKKALKERIENSRKELRELMPHQDGFARLICAEIAADERALAELD